MSQNAPSELSQERLFDMLQSPLKMIREGGKFGLKTARTLFLTVFGFGILNFILIIYATIRMFGGDVSTGKVLFLLLMLVVAVGLTVFAGYRAYQMALMDILGLVYRKSENQIRNLCSRIVDKGINVQSSSNLGKSINLKDWVNELFGRLPRVFQRLLIFVLDQVPVTAIYREVQTDIQTGNTEGAKDKFYVRVDQYIMETFFETNRTIWLLGLFIINILIQGAIIYFKILR